MIPVGDWTVLYINDKMVSHCHVEWGSDTGVGNITTCSPARLFNNNPGRGLDFILHKCQNIVTLLCGVG